MSCLHLNIKFEENSEISQFTYLEKSLTLSTSTLQGDQDEWSQGSISTAGSKVEIFLGFTKLASAG